MPIEKLRSVIADLMNKCNSADSNLLSVSNATIFGEIKNALNEIMPEYKCTEVLYTNNFDSLLFGVKISPKIGRTDLTCIIGSDDPCALNRYKIEIDSKLFSIGLTVDEVLAVILHDICAIMDPITIEYTRRLIDYNLVTSDDYLDIRNSNTALLAFAVKDTMRKLSSVVYNGDEDVLCNNTMIARYNLKEELLSAKDKIDGALFTTIDGYNNYPKTVILKWMLTMLQNMRINSMVVIDTLQDADAATGSRIEQEEIRQAIKSVNKIDSEIPLKEGWISLDKYFDRNNISINEVSLFGKLKRSGLRSLEDDLYEFSIRVRNCRDADEGYSILRGINSRLGLLEDYLSNEDLNDNERMHWERVAMQYRELRAALSRKKFKEKSWGIFIDYNALDSLDANRSDRPMF